MHDFAYKTFSPKKFLPIDVAVLNLIHDLYFQTDIPLGLSFHIIFCGSLEKVSAIIFSDESLSAPTTVPNDTKITPSSPAFWKNWSISSGRDLAGLARNGPTTRVSRMKWRSHDIHYGRWSAINLVSRSESHPIRWIAFFSKLALHDSRKSRIVHTILECDSSKEINGGKTYKFIQASIWSIKVLKCSFLDRLINEVKKVKLCWWGPAPRWMT